MRYCGFTLSLAAVWLVACSSAPMRPEDSAAVPPHRIERPELVAPGPALDGAKARIRFTRDDGSLMVMGGCGYNLHLDHVPLATVGNGESLAVDVPPGQYVAHFNLTAVLCPAFTSSTVAITATRGVEVRVRMGLRDGQPFLQPGETVRMAGRP